MSVGEISIEELEEGRGAIAAAAPLNGGPARSLSAFQD